MEVSETTCLEASGPSRQELLSAKESEKNRIKSENFPQKITVSGPEYGLWLKNLNVAWEFFWTFKTQRSYIGHAFHNNHKSKGNLRF